MRYITEYQGRWPASFEKITRAIRMKLPGACEIHHVGATAIPGMPSKDIIDLTIECPKGGMAAVIRGLADLGYEHQGNKGLPGREAFRPLRDSVAEELPAHHLYACEASAMELRKHLAFRDYLLAHPEKMNWLAEQKRLADQGATSRDEYIANKVQAYEAMTAQSLAWAAAAGPRATNRKAST